MRRVKRIVASGTRPSPGQRGADPAIVKLDNAVERITGENKG
jgi:hypothetical protein